MIARAWTWLCAPGRAVGARFGAWRAARRARQAAAWRDRQAALQAIATGAGATWIRVRQDTEAFPGSRVVLLLSRPFPARVTGRTETRGWWSGTRFYVAFYVLDWDRGVTFRVPFEACCRFQEGMSCTVHGVSADHGATWRILDPGEEILL